MHDDVANDGDAAPMDRRALIKKIGVAGAVAWTAPVVMDSVRSPAAAQSVPGGGGGCTPFTPYATSFAGVSNTGGGPGFPPPQEFETYDSGEQLGTTGWFVGGGAGANVDAVTLPGLYSAGFAGNGSLIDLGGTGNTVPASISRQFAMGCAAAHTFEFDWKNQSAANAVLTNSGSSFSTDSFTLTTGTGPTADQQVSFTTTTDNDSVTITFTQGDATNTGAFVGNFSLS